MLKKTGGSYTVIASKDGHEKSFTVESEILQRSPVIKDWIENPHTMGASLTRDGALVLGAAPEVVNFVIRYLEREDKESTDGFSKSYMFDESGRDRNVLFNAQVYKIARSLAIEQLCINTLSKMNFLPCGTEAFLDVVAMDTGLIEWPRFRAWIVEYVQRKAETLEESSLFKTAIMNGGSVAWNLCSIMILSIGSQRPRFDIWSPTPPETPNPNPSSRGRSIRTSISTSRNRSLYSYGSKPLPKFKIDLDTGEDERVGKKRKYQAIVDDASDSH